MPRSTHADSCQMLWIKSHSVNTRLIQSTVSDAVQLAMDKMQAWRAEHNMHFEIQNQIHDAVMLHVPKSEIEETKYMFRHTLGDIHIPLGPDKYFTLGVDIDVYERWGQKVKE